MDLLDDEQTIERIRELLSALESDRLMVHKAAKQELLTICDDLVNVSLITLHGNLTLATILMSEKDYYRYVGVEILMRLIDGGMHWEEIARNATFFRQTIEDLVENYDVLSEQRINDMRTACVRLERLKKVDSQGVAPAETSAADTDNRAGGTASAAIGVKDSERSRFKRTSSGKSLLKPSSRSKRPTESALDARRAKRSSTVGVRRRSESIELSSAAGGAQRSARTQSRTLSSREASDTPSVARALERLPRSQSTRPASMIVMSSRHRSEALNTSDPSVTTVEEARGAASRAASTNLSRNNSRAEQQHDDGADEQEAAPTLERLVSLHHAREYETVRALLHVADKRTRKEFKKVVEEEKRKKKAGSRRESKHDDGKAKRAAARAKRKQAAASNDAILSNKERSSSSSKRPPAPSPSNAARGADDSAADPTKKSSSPSKSKKDDANKTKESRATPSAKATSADASSSSSSYSSASTVADGTAAALSGARRNDPTLDELAAALLSPAPAPMNLSSSTNIPLPPTIVGDSDSETLCDNPVSPRTRDERISKIDIVQRSTSSSTSSSSSRRATISAAAATAAAMSRSAASSSSSDSDTSTERDSGIDAASGAKAVVRARADSVRLRDSVQLSTKSASSSVSNSDSESSIIDLAGDANLPDDVLANLWEGDNSAASGDEEAPQSLTVLAPRYGAAREVVFTELTTVWHVAEQCRAWIYDLMAAHNEIPAQMQVARRTSTLGVDSANGAPARKPKRRTTFIAGLKMRLHRVHGVVVDMNALPPTQTLHGCRLRPHGDILLLYHGEQMPSAADASVCGAASCSRSFDSYEALLRHIGVRHPAVLSRTESGTVLLDAKSVSPPQASKSSSARQRIDASADDENDTASDDDAWWANLRDESVETQLAAVVSRLRRLKRRMLLAFGDELVAKQRRAMLSASVAELPDVRGAAALRSLCARVDALENRYVRVKEREQLDGARIAAALEEKAAASASNDDNKSLSVSRVAQNSKTADERAKERELLNVLAALPKASSERQLDHLTKDRPRMAPRRRPSSMSLRRASIDKLLASAVDGAHDDEDVRSASPGAADQLSGKVPTISSLGNLSKVSRDGHGGGGSGASSASTPKSPPTSPMSSSRSTLSTARGTTSTSLSNGTLKAAELDSDKLLRVVRGRARPNQPATRDVRADTTTDNMFAKRTKVSLSILESEERYVRCLATLVDGYKRQLEAVVGTKKEVCSLAETRLMFTGIQGIYNTNRVLLEAYSQRLHTWHPYSVVSDIFIQMSDFFKVYIQYANNFDRSIDAIESLFQENKQFRKLCNDVEKRSGLGLDVVELMLLPVQRIPHYCLQLEQMLRYTHSTHPDYAGLHQAVDRLHSVSCLINDTMRETQMRTRVFELEIACGEEARGWAQPHRMVKREVGVKYARNPNDEYTSGYVILFNDMLVLLDSEPRRPDTSGGASKRLSGTVSGAASGGGGGGGRGGGGGSNTSPGSAGESGDRSSMDLSGALQRMRKFSISRREKPCKVVSRCHLPSVKAFDLRGPGDAHLIGIHSLSDQSSGFFMELATEKDRDSMLRLIQECKARSIHNMLTRDLKAMEK